MAFLKKQLNASYSIIVSFMLFSCATRGPGYAAREALYEKSAQPEIIQKVAKVEEEISTVKVEAQENVQESKVANQDIYDEAWLSEGRSEKKALVTKGLPLKEKKSSRSISSQQVFKTTKVLKEKKSKSFSNVVIDDLDLEVVPSTSSSSGKGFLLND